MKLTPNRLRFYAEIEDECRYIAEDFNNVVRRYGIDFRVGEFAEVSVDRKEELIEVSGSYKLDGCGCCWEDYTIQVPFGFIEDPIAWEDQWHEDQHQKMLDAIAKKISDKKEKVEKFEAHEKAEYERLKEKYE